MHSPLVKACVYVNTFDVCVYRKARGKSGRGGEQSAGFIGVTNELLIQFHGRRACDASAGVHSPAQPLDHRTLLALTSRTALCVLVFKCANVLFEGELFHSAAVLLEISLAGYRIFGQPCSRIVEYSAAEY